MRLAWLSSILAALAVSSATSASGDAPLSEIWGEGWPFQGISTFAHLPSQSCLVDRSLEYDIAVIGVPFDTAVSYRPGARFGPRAIRQASQRQTSLRGFNPRALHNPYRSWAKVIDCGDIPVTPVDNHLAFDQMTKAFEELLFEHSSANNKSARPRYVALGGDHSVILPHLRGLHKLYGPLNVIHLDAHLDSWKPDKYPSYWHTDQSEINHGSMLWKAWDEGLTTNRNVHGGLRTKLSGTEDWEDDDEQGWVRISADDIWLKGIDHVIKTILDRVPADTPTYISVDIDVLDPGFGSGTGTQEPGGWLPRELINLLRNLDSLSIVGADIVEVSPDLDHAEVTSTNGAQVAYELITSMSKKGPLSLPINDDVKANYKNSNTRIAEHNQEVLDAFVDDKSSEAFLNHEVERLQHELQQIKKLQAAIKA